MRKLIQRLEMKTVLTAFLAVALVISAGLIQATDIIDSGNQSGELVAEYRFDTGAGTTAYDTARNNEGVLKNGPKWKDGIDGKALKFDGSNDNVDIGEPTPLTASSLEDSITLSVWVKKDSCDSTENIIGKSSDGNNDNYRLWLNSDCTVTFYLDGAGYSDSASESIKTGKWVHIVGTYDGSSKKIYYNGREKFSTSVSGNLADASGSPVAIGSRGGDSQFYQGKIDTAQIYSVGLNHSQVKSLYNQGVWRVGTETSSNPDNVLDVSFQHQNSSHVYDTSGQGNHGSRENDVSQSGALKCKVGRCYNLDGNDDWVDLGDLGNPSGGTIMFWFKKPEVDAGAQYFLDGRGTGNWWFLQDYNGYDVNFDNTVRYNGISPDTWYHIAVTTDSNSAQLYENGVLKDNSSGFSPDFSSVRIGTRYTNSGYFEGKIDQVKIFNRSLSQREIIQKTEGLESPDDDIAQFTSQNTTLDINQNSWTDIPWDTPLDPAGRTIVTHDEDGTPQKIKFQEDGLYRVKAMLSYTDSNYRENPGIRFTVNGNSRQRRGLSGYVRGGGGDGCCVDDTSSNYLEEFIEVNEGDTLKVQTLEYANSGTVNLQKNESLLTVEKLDGKAAAFTSDDTSVDINSGGVNRNSGDWNELKWTHKLVEQNDFISHNPSSPKKINFDKSGTYRIKTMTTYDGSSNRENPAPGIEINGNVRDRIGLSGYLRSGSGHNQVSNYVEDVVRVSEGDTLKILSQRMANSGTMNLRQNESVLLIEEVDQDKTAAFSADRNYSINFQTDTLIEWNQKIEDVSARPVSYDTSNNPGEIVFDKDGTYRVYASVSYDAFPRCTSCGYRRRPAIKFNINGDWTGRLGNSGYLRVASGQYEASTYSEEYLSVSEGDTLTVETVAETTRDGNNYDRNTTLRANESILIVEKVSDRGPVSIDPGSNEVSDQKVLDIGFDRKNSSHVKDASGNNNHGELKNSPTEKISSECKVGKCLSFDGGSDQVNVKGSSSFNMAGDFAVSAWAKTSDTGDYRQVVDKRGSGAYGCDRSEAGWFLRPIRSGDGDAEFVVGNGTCSYGAQASQNWVDGKWHHYVGVREKGNQIALYVDGEQVATHNDDGGSTASDDDIVIGGEQNWNGSIDQVRVYNRSLSKDEIWSLFSKGRDREGGMAGTIGHWGLDEGKVGTESNPARSCRQIHSLRPNAGSGMYWVTGTLGTQDAFKVQCEMSAKGGGWTNISLDHTNSNIGVGNDPDRCSAAGDSAKFYNHLSTSDYNFLHDTDDHNIYDYEVNYTSGGYSLTQDQKQALSNTVRQVSNDTKPVAVSCDDDYSGIEHNTYFYDTKGNRFEAQDGYVSNSNNVGYWLWHESSENSSSQSTASISGQDNSALPGKYIMPEEVGLQTDANGYAVFSYEKEYALVRDDTTTWIGDSGGKNDGSISGKPEWVSGRRGKALDFSGTHDYVDLGKNYQYSDSEAFSVSFWVKGGIVNNNERVLGFDTNPGWGFLYDNFIDSDEDLVFRYDGTNLQYEDITSNHDKWLHITIVHDGSGGLTGYVNGKQSTSTTGASWTTPDDKFLLGDVGEGSSCNWCGQTDNFQGKLDDVRIYPYALNQEQIKQVMNGGGSAYAG